MAREFDSTQLEYLQRNEAVRADYATAFVCWFKCNDITNGYCLMSICNRIINGHNIALYAQGAVAGDPVRFQMSTPVGGWVIADTTAGYTANTWHHACGIWAYTDDRRVFLDGGNKGTDATACLPTVNTTAIGVMCRPAPASYLDGCIAEAAIYGLGAWPGATFAELADNFEKILPSLAAGYSPLNFPLGLRAYWPLIRDDDLDIRDNFDLTPFNTPTVAEHPGIIMPMRSQLTTPKSVRVGFGKFRSDPMLTGKTKSVPALSGGLINKPALTGKMKSEAAIIGGLINRPALTGKLKNS